MPSTFMRGEKTHIHVWGGKPEGKANFNHDLLKTPPLQLNSLATCSENFQPRNLGVWAQGKPLLSTFRLICALVVM